MRLAASLQNSGKTMSNEEATKVVSKLYREWADALANHREDWFQRHISDDFALTAHPFSQLRLNKKEFIAVDMKAENTQIKFLDIKATSAGEILISQAVAEVKEDFKADLGAGMPSAAEVTNMLSGKVLAYASAWRKNADVWQCFDHHMFGPVHR
jgi:hypothetical protein